MVFSRRGSTRRTNEARDPYGARKDEVLPLSSTFTFTICVSNTAWYLRPRLCRVASNVFQSMTLAFSGPNPFGRKKWKDRQKRHWKECGGKNVSKECNDGRFPVCLLCDASPGPMTFCQPSRERHRCRLERVKVFSKWSVQSCYISRSCLRA